MCCSQDEAEVALMRPTAEKPSIIHKCVCVRGGGEGGENSSDGYTRFGSKLAGFRGNGWVIQVKVAASRRD